MSLVGITPWLNGSKKTGTLKIPRAFAILGIFTENFGRDVYVCMYGGWGGLTLPNQGKK